MLNQAEKQHFIDISGINYKEIDIEFSVENLLRDDYLMLPQRTQKQPKQKSKKSAASQKLEKGVQLKHANQQADRNRKKSVFRGARSKQCCQEKDTQDDSQTVKFSNKHMSPQIITPRKINRKDSKHKEEIVKFASNKIQPNKKERSRTKSTSVVTARPKNMQSGLGSPCGTPIRSKVSFGIAKSYNQLSKVRSQTIRGNNDDVKAKNANIVRNDYFDGQQIVDEPVNKLNREVDKRNKERSISSQKRVEVATRKMKKVNIQQNAGLKSPKPQKK